MQWVGLGFCVPVANMMVPCRNEGTTTERRGAYTARGGCNSSGVELELCNDGNTVALVGKKTLVVFAIKCAEPTLANVVGCGQEIGSDVSNNYVHAVVMPDSASRAFSLVTGAPDASVWGPVAGSGSAAGKLENEALQTALVAAYGGRVQRHRDCPFG